MKIVHLSPDAEQDFLDAYNYLEEHSPEAADRWEEGMYLQFDHLVRHPLTGHHRLDLAPAPIRAWVVGNYLIFYNPEKLPFEIVAILHGSRDLPTSFRGRIL